MIKLFLSIARQTVQAAPSSNFDTTAKFRALMSGR